MNLLTVVMALCLLGFVVFVCYATSKLWEASSVLHMDMLDYLRASSPDKKELLAKKYQEELSLIKHRLLAILTSQQTLQDDDADAFLLDKAIEFLDVEWAEFKVKGGTIVCIRIDQEYDNGSLSERLEIDTIPADEVKRLKRLLSVKFIAMGGRQ